MIYKFKTFCRCCKSKELVRYLNLGKQPLANSYHTGEKLPLVPLEVMVCQNCFHNQLSVVVNPVEMFRNYLYVSGTTETFRNHTKELARDATSRMKSKKLNVLDIACNDGTQLEFFRLLGCEVMGVDPAENLRPITKKKDIPVLVDYWTQDVAQSINKKFDIITGTNVFAHVDNVDEFLLATKIVLAEDGYLILEFPYADTMISHNEFDTVYHEHLSYFLVNSFSTLATRLDFSITDIIRTSIHGGSIRFFLQNKKNKHCMKVSELIKQEKVNGLLNLRTYSNYSLRVKKNKADMKKIIKGLKIKGKKIIGYAASAKGNTMLNYFKIDLDYIIDDNELKWDYVTPGRNISIKDPKTIVEEKAELYIVILAWNFYNEIAKRLVMMRRNKKDSAILYVPDVQVKSLSESSLYKQSA